MDSSLTESPEDPWDVVIEPHRSLLAVDSREVWAYRDLLVLLIRRDLVAFYKQTILGPIWFILQPLLTTVVYIVAFHRIAGLSTEGSPPILFYLGGIVLWNYFADCLQATATTFKDNAAVFGKVYFPRIISPLSTVVSNLIKMGLQASLFAIVYLYYLWQDQVRPIAGGLLLLPIILGCVVLISLGAGLMLSAATSKYRDLIFLLNFGTQLLMYATPVIYPMSEVPSNLADVIRWNPLTPLFETTRYALLGVGTHSWTSLVYSATFAILLMTVSLIVFHRVEQTFMDSV